MNEGDIVKINKEDYMVAKIFVKDGIKNILLMVDDR